MAKKKDDIFYKNLEECVSLASDAVVLVEEFLGSYSREIVPEYRKKMHDLENKADAKKHEQMKAITESFITPIECEDLVALSSYIDDIVDSIEDIIIQIYIADVAEIRQDVLPIIAILKDVIAKLSELMVELPDFKKSKKMHDIIIEVNDLEEKGDKLYIEAMRTLYQENDIRIVMIWKDLYECLENTIDTCEHVADTVHTVVMKNL